MITAPKIQDNIAAGPAILAAEPAPNNQPEPINELRASMIAENSPILCRFSFSTQSLIPTPMNILIVNYNKNSPAIKTEPLFTCFNRLDAFALKHEPHP